MHLKKPKQWSLRAETCLAVARILVYSLGFVRLLYWHTSEIFMSYRHKERAWNMWIVERSDGIEISETGTLK